MSVRRAITSWEPEWPAEFPGVLADRATTRVGSENSQRNPQRTASTAAALMIGLALVALVATLAAGIIKPFKDAVDELFTSDYAITAQNNFDPIPPAPRGRSPRRPGSRRSRASVVATDTSSRVPPGKAIQVTGAEPQTSEVISLEWQTGTPSTIDTLGANGAVVSKDYAKDHDLTVGSPIPLLTPTGELLLLVLKGIFAPPTGGSPFGNVTVSSATFDAHWQQPLNLFTFIKMRGGVTDANTAALKAALKAFPNAKAQTRTQFKDNQVGGFKQVLNILYVLLALSVVISLFGIVNTLVLTVFERTRELGMLRAIGMTRRQVRRMIRHESVITALIGAALGLLLGVVLGGLFAIAVKEIVFAVPWLQLVIFTIAAILVGILAAIFPARRAAGSTRSRPCTTSSVRAIDRARSGSAVAADPDRARSLKGPPAARPPGRDPADSDRGMHRYQPLSLWGGWRARRVTQADSGRAEGGGDVSTTCARCLLLRASATSSAS